MNTGAKNDPINQKAKGFWADILQSRLLIEASLWSADPTHFSDEIKRMDPWADMYHIDVSDGHFVPGLLFYADLVAALRPLCSKPIHVHLMTDNPFGYIADFKAAGADLISIHAENGPIVPAALDAIRRQGIAAGIVLGLDYPVGNIAPYLDLVDLVTLMGTPIGIKGVQPSEFIYDRIKEMKRIILNAGKQYIVKVFADGGIRENTVPRLRSAGADGVIAGSLVFKSHDLKKTIEWLHGL